MRGLKALVIGLGVLIAVGLIVIAVTIANRMTTEPEPAPAAATLSVDGFGSARVTIPAGARIVETATGDGRMVLRIHLVDGRAQILVIDLATGRLAGTVDVIEAPN